MPSVLGENAALAKIFTVAWNTQVSAGAAIYTGSPEGEGIVLTHRAREPLDVTTALRVAWE